MAITGLIGVAFATLHMYGNLKIFQGREHFNAYAAFIRSFGEPLLPHYGFLWMLRTVLLGAVLLHIASAALLTQQSWAGRRVRYARRRDVQATFASRTMRWGGVLLILFLIHHLLHITVGALHPHFEPGNAHANTVIGYQSWPVSLAAIAAMLVFGLHVYHGFWSMFQTLGANNARASALLRGAALLLAAGLAVGYIAVPVAVLAGVVHL